jgi:predicted ATPase
VSNETSDFRTDIGAAATSIKRLTLRGFKGFLDATLPLAGLTVVVGTNAAGKSNLRDAFRFLHGIARGYTLAEIIGEKYVEGGVLQWKGIRGGTQEVTFFGSREFTIEVGLELIDRSKQRSATYEITVEIPGGGKPPRVLSEKLVVDGRGSYIFKAEADASGQGDSRLLIDVPLSGRDLRTLRAGGVVFLKAPQAAVSSDGPAIAQLANHEGILRMVRTYAELTLRALRSMRFLDLSPDAMRIPSIPGQVILGDRGENLSSVLQSICADATRREMLSAWIRQLTPLDVSDFYFPEDATGRVIAVLVESSGRRTTLNSASDGTLRFLAMIAAFLGPDRARFYFFEELDTGLHPTRLHLLLDLIERQTSRGFTQVVATTHSPQLLTLLSEESQRAAVLAYRLPETEDQRLVRVWDLPDARRILGSQDLSQLHATGWLEDAAAFAAYLKHPSKVAE